jgi:hypothetical protein
LSDWPEPTILAYQVIVFLISTDATAVWKCFDTILSLHW